MIFPVTGRHSCVDACYREGSQSNGVKQVHYLLISRDIPAFQYLLVQPDQDKEHHGREKGRVHVNRVHEQAGRYDSQYNVPEHSAADSSGDAQDHHSQQVQALFDGHQGTGRGKGHGSDYFYDKKD